MIFQYFKKSLQFIQEQLIIYKKYISFSSEQIKLNWSTSNKKKFKLNTCPEELLSNSLLLTITAFDNLPTSETITSYSHISFKSLCILPRNSPSCTNHYTRTKYQILHIIIWSNKLSIQLTIRLFSNSNNI